jgi:hypothetical protein
VRSITTIAHAACGRIGRPAFPAPSFRRERIKEHLEQKTCCEIAKLCLRTTWLFENRISSVIAREGGRSSIPKMMVMESTSRGVLDTPHARGMTT